MKSTLLIFIDPFQDSGRADRKDETRFNKYSLRVLDFIKEPSNSIDYFFLSVYDCPSFLKNEKWCGNTSKRISLQNRVFTKKIAHYKPARDGNHVYCSSLDDKFDDFNHKNILSTSAFFAEDLKNFLDSFPTIRNVMIAGEAWQQCVKFRPLGIYNVVNVLKEYKKVNLVINTNLIGGMASSGIPFSEDGNHIVGEPSWEKIGDSMFYLPKEKYDSYLQEDIFCADEFKRTVIENDNHHKDPSIPSINHIELILNDSISAKHITLDLFDKVSNSDF